MDENIFMNIKAAVVLFCGAFGAAFGWQGWLVVVFAGCMLADYISGTAVACKDGKWASGVAREGLYHKAGMIFAVCVAAGADEIITMALDNLPVVALPFDYVGLLFPLTLCWYIVTELGSILENAVNLGAPVPVVLSKTLAMAKDAMDGTDNKSS